MKDHIIDEKYDYKEIGICGFDYKLFGLEEGGGNRKRLDRYPYLKHLIHLWPVDWVRYTEKRTKRFVRSIVLHRIGEGNGQFGLSKGKSYGNVLIVIHRQLPMGIKDTGFGFK